MAPVKNGRVIFNEIPEGYPEPGKTTIYDEKQTIDLDNVPLKGGFLVKTLVLSVDPYLRFKMRDPKIESYSPAYHIGEPIDNFGVGVVLRSESSEVKAGDHVYGILPFQEYFVREKLGDYRILQNKEGLPWSVYLGMAGMPGQTAYSGWKEYASAKKGDTVFVTAGSGPVGSFVIQNAKHDGLKVIASAGSEEKVKFLKSIGADVAFNYKTTKTSDVLAKEGPVDVYWDNVGGESLDAALEHASKGARFLMCGMITGYNEKAPPVYNLVQVFAKELKFFGILIFSLLPKYADDFYREIPQRIANGEFKYIEDKKHGLNQAEHAIIDVQRGKNHGKSVVQVAEE